MSESHHRGKQHHAWKPPEPTTKNDNNTPKVDTVNESDAEEDENENEEKIQYKEGFEFQVNSPSPVEQHVWKAYRRHGIHPRRQPRFEQRYPSDQYMNLMVQVFIELNLNQVLKIFVSERIKANKSEMQQVHDKVVFHPIKGEQLAKKQKH